MKLKSWAKTSGSKGLQIYVPLNTAVTYEQTKALSHALAEYLEREHPGTGCFQNVESAAEGKNLRRLEPERRTQDDDLCLLVARQGPADRVDAGDLARKSRKR